MQTQMTWDDFTAAREEISNKIGLPKKMNLPTFEQFLGVNENTSTNWKRRESIPPYIKNSVDAHLMLSKTALQKIYKDRVNNA